ncbi:MAG: carboxypeptidase regulatory-like domain-containing protein [Candidatus Levybacteria bacterium]|nr:carboxypeptidase regulatory-like domain-containing protein [Candidatus Levybacteria bacterium]
MIIPAVRLTKKQLFLWLITGIFSILLGLLLQQKSLAATVYVSGNVYDTSYNPLFGASVSIKGPVSYTQSTNSAGGFAFIVPSDSYSLTASYPGFIAKSQPVNVGSGPISTYFLLQRYSQSKPPPGNTGSTTNPKSTATPTPAKKSISGRVFIVTDSGAISGRYNGTRINLHNDRSGTNAHDTTNSAGYYSFSGLAYGRETYTVSLVVPSGYTAVSQTSLTKTLNDGDKITVDFKIRSKPGTGGISLPPSNNSSSSKSKSKVISGHVYIVDADGNRKGTYDGARITAQNKTSGTQKHTTTDSSGAYTMTGFAGDSQTYIVTLQTIPGLITVGGSDREITLDDARPEVTINFNIRRSAQALSPTSAPSARIFLNIKVVDGASLVVPGASVSVCPVVDDSSSGQPCKNGTAGDAGEVTIPVSTNSKFEVLVTKGSLTNRDIVYTKEANKSVTIPLFKQTITTSVGGSIQIVNQNGELLSTHYTATEIRVSLSGDKVASTTTRHGDGITGWYEFENLKVGTYTVSMKVPDGYEMASDNPIRNIKTVANGRTVANFRIVRSDAAEEDTEPDEPVRIKPHKEPINTGDESSIEDTRRPRRPSDRTRMTMSVSPDETVQNQQEVTPPDHPVTVSVFAAGNPDEPIAQGESVLTFDGEKGQYVTEVELESKLPPDEYTVLVKVDKHLSERVPEIIIIEDDEDTDVEIAHDLRLIAGDVDNDDELSILDFNVLSDCYSDVNPARECTQEQKLQADLNSDGEVNQYDYNLFLRGVRERSLSSQ